MVRKTCLKTDEVELNCAPPIRSLVKFFMFSVVLIVYLLPYYYLYNLGKGTQFYTNKYKKKCENIAKITLFDIFRPV